ncbi:MAG: hypothetical protein A3A86_08015 [Elusimicrobia bacterium RIFCSPLOWO2_01_FULL_60_11]|nr:MAG: hypothetical protein A3A86_08015 [Elusimicrobia bacterium RIFCSPLOWO2_01_FULL_60_11]
MRNSHERIAAEWFSKAESDLNFAKASFKDFDEFYSQMCLLCHDAVEKFLKGFIIAKGRKPKKIHDILVLLKECQKIDEDFASFAQECRILNRYYTPLKYPSYFPPLSKEDAERAIETAAKIQEFVTGALE